MISWIKALSPAYMSNFYVAIFICCIGQLLCDSCTFLKAGMLDFMWQIKVVTHLKLFVWTRWYINVTIILKSSVSFLYWRHLALYPSLYLKGISAVWNYYWHKLTTNIWRSSTLANKNCHIKLRHKNCSCRQLGL